MRAEFDIKLTEKDLYAFNMHHAYTGGQGLMSLILAILAFFVAFQTKGEVEPVNTTLEVLVGVLFVVYIPFTLKLKARQLATKSPVFRNPITFVIDEEGITSKQEENEAFLSWEQVYKVKRTKQSILIYSTRVNAFILPLNQMGEQMEVVRELVLAKLPKDKITKKF